MAIIITDDIHYKNIANKIREFKGTSETLFPNDMANKIGDVYIQSRVDFLKARDGGHLFQDKYIYDDMLLGIEKVKFTTGASMFSASTNKTSLTWNEIISKIDFSDIKNMSYAFQTIFNLYSFPEIDVSSATTLAYFLYNCTALTSVGGVKNTGNVTTMESMFKSCKKLSSIPDFDDTNKLTSCSSMFQDCEVLKVAPKLNTAKVTNVYNMFSGCTQLTTIENLDMRAVTNNTYFVNKCTNLTVCKLQNIKKTLQVGSGTTYGHKIELESLLFMIKEVIKQSSSIKLTVGSANLAKLNGIYVKLIDITDEMRAEDEFIDSKYPFEVCKSTDEGAMLINDYYTLKNLTLA